MAEQQKKRKKININRSIVIPFVGCLLLIMLMNLVTPVKKVSEEENRSLAGKPELSRTGVLSGTYMRQYEDYQADQFIGRNFWRNMKVRLGRLGGSREENGVYLGKQNQLLADIVLPDEETLQKNIDAILEFTAANKDISVTAALIPDAASILQDKLPPLADLADQKAMIKGVRRQLEEELSWVDASKVMNQHKDEDIYYKTDHHWTSLGAYYVFKETEKSLGISSDYEVKYKSYAVTTGFNGSLSSKSGYAQKEKEEIDIYVAEEEEIDVVVNYVEEQKKRTSLYDSSKLETKDKYAMFFGGNYGLLDIKTTAGSNRRLLLFKDSYANCFVQFLTPYFREIIVVDPRYYAGTAEELIATYNITDAMFLYNANTFFGDNNISGVLTSE